jgi:amidase
MHSAFILPFDTAMQGQASGTLKNKTFGLKDVFDVTGYPTSFGSPDWLKSHELATETAFVVHQLLNQGATLLGKTHTE